MNTYKNKSIIQLSSLIVFLILLNFIGSFFYFRLDLTSEKKYTLSEISKEKLKQLDDIVYFQIYLDGKELPPGLERLKQNVKEMLNEFKVIAGDNIAFEFVNPNETVEKKEKNLIYKELMSKGLEPTNIQERTEEGSLSQKTVFTGGFVHYQGKEVVIEFLSNNPTLNAEQNLNNAIQDIEFHLMSSIKKLSEDQPDRIAFIEGHGELNKMRTADIGKALSDFYLIERIKIEEKIYALCERREREEGDWALFNKYKAIIIAGPTERFSEKDKYIIDQYIMNGGNVLWLLNGTNANMDSLAMSSYTMAMVQDLNLEDQLFTYGVRINADLVEDMQCSAIPIDVQTGSKAPDYKLFPWPFFPLVSSSNQHPITRNLNLVKMEFASSIDTIGRKSDIKRTPLLFTSKNSKKLNAPVRVGLNIINHDPDIRQFNKSYIPTAYLLEGQFNSVFAGRMTNQFSGLSEVRFREKSRASKMIVVSDASVMRNDVKRGLKGYTPLPLGKDKFTGQTIGNKQFLLNSINYLCDESGILNMRTKDYKIRLLDHTKIQGRKLFWQLLNLLAPLALILLFGALVFGYRKKRFKA